MLARMSKFSNVDNCVVLGSKMGQSDVLEEAKRAPIPANHASWSHLGLNLPSQDHEKQYQGSKMLVSR